VSVQAISELKGVGSELEKKLAILGIYTIDDLIQNFPRRYDDYSNLTPIASIRPGVVSIKAVIKQAKGRYVRRGMHITEAVASDDSGSVRLVWFNQPYREASIKSDQEYFISGNFELSYRRLSIMNPAMELASDFPVNTARIIPIYRETKGFKSSAIRKLIREALQRGGDLTEPLPPDIVRSQKLMDYKDAVYEMHFPSSIKQLDKARHRLGFQEIFTLSLAALLNKYELAHQHALSIPFTEQLAKDFVAKLPFTLTNAQRKVVWKIYQDMEKSYPMNRLVEGDVGAGKTVVAAMTAIMAMEQGFQVALMAPTEILARQHAETLYKLMDAVGFGHQVGLLIGGLKPKQKELVQSKIASGEVRLMVGTHALITEKVDMHNLGVIIIDEQHRFGVEQRKKLQAKAGHMPHVLHMTATPIPRSLALTLYGELDISILDELPPGRQTIITKIVSPNSRAQLNAKIEAELSAGHQMFVVCPLITDSESSNGLSAEEVHERLSKREFKHRTVGLLHGKLKPIEKDEVMQKFVRHEYDILVSTTVIEVGVDVPNASVMLLEGAERFGLAQIHQLRGRVGRGQHQSYCYLMMSDSKAPSTRLRALETTSDGFKLAELDLSLRGPGAIYGTMQHGALDLRVAKLTDVKLIATARQAAQKAIDEKLDFKEYAQLNQKVKELRAITNLN
jgi:ATP-dependent DNA helicase RecG